jgi:hypothetical protein
VPGQERQHADRDGASVSLHPVTLPAVEHSGREVALTLSLLRLAPSNQGLGSLHIAN